MGHPLYGRCHELHVGVNNSVWVHVGQLDGLSDLARQALGSGPAILAVTGCGHCIRLHNNLFDMEII